MLLVAFSSTVSAQSQGSAIVLSTGYNWSWRYPVFAPGQLVTLFIFGLGVKVPYLNAVIADRLPLPYTMNGVSVVERLGPEGEIPGRTVLWWSS
jgi:hypothetical protein